MNPHPWLGPGKRLQHVDARVGLVVGVAGGQTMPSDRPNFILRGARLATQFSGGEQQMLALGRALVLNPTLLLDEPCEGLAPIIVQELLRAIRRITRDEGLSAIIVEQHPQAILAISDTAAVLDHGTVVYTGTARSLQEQPAVLYKLLGVAR